MTPFSFASATVAHPNVVRLVWSCRFGFDTWGQALVTTASVLTVDGWDELVKKYQAPDVIASNWSWTIFALAVLVLSLFAVNLFLAGLAYSFIKVRAASRSLDSSNTVKKTFVERMLQENRSISGRDRHILQILNPLATRWCKRALAHHYWGSLITLIVSVNLVFMAADHHDKSDETILIFEWGEGIFTLIYLAECIIKLQAMGFAQYFSIILNRLDFIIVCSSVLTYLLKLWSIVLEGQGTAVLRMLRMLKFLRAARVVKIIFRSEPVRAMIALAFRGLDAVFSLVVFIAFILVMSAVVGMNVFYQCYGPDGMFEDKMPAYSEFGKSLLVSFQVLTGDSWTGVMYNHMECVGSGAAVFFIFLQYTCSFVLCNLFVAIFMENFDMEDEEKREIQIGNYISGLVVREEETGNAWVKGVHAGVMSVENLLADDGMLNVVRKKTASEFISAAKMGAQATMYAGKKVVSLAPEKVKAPVNTFNETTRTVTKNTRCSRAKASCRRRLGIVKDSSTPSSHDWLGGAANSTAAKKDASALKWRNGGWATRKFHQNLHAKPWFHHIVLVVIGLSVVDSALIPNVSDMTDAQSVLFYLLERVLFLFFTVDRVL